MEFIASSKLTRKSKGNMFSQKIVRFIFTVFDDSNSSILHFIESLNKFELIDGLNKFEYHKLLI